MNSEIPMIKQDKIKKPYITQEINENYVNAGKSWLGIQRGEYQNCFICG